MPDDLEERTEDKNPEPKIEMVDSLSGVYINGNGLYIQVIGGREMYLGPSTDAWKFRRY